MNNVKLERGYVAQYIRNDIPVSEWIIDENGNFVSYNKSLKNTMREMGNRIQLHFDNMVRDILIGDNSPSDTAR